VVRPLRRTFVERHSVAVDVPPADAVAAARAVTLDELPVVRALYRLRGLPARRGTFESGLVAIGFQTVEDGPERLVLQATGRPWRPGGGIGDPNGARMTLALWAEPGRLLTETRVECPDDATARAFRRYWLAIRPFSGLIRRLLLRAARQRTLTVSETVNSARR
jgi:hypothetical protein